jgi:integrase
MDEIPEIHPYNRGTARKPNYFARYRFQGAQHKEPTGARTLKEFAVAKAKIEALITSGRWQPYAERKAGAPADNFATFAQQVLERRVEMGVKSAKKDEAGIIANHLDPEFGRERLQDVASYARIELGFQRIQEKDIGGATVRNIYLVFRTIMRFAAKKGLILAEPPQLSIRDGELPPMIERRPEGWRDDAIFTIEEIAKLLAAEAIEPQYRCMYAVYFLTGSRFAEVTNIRVSDYIRSRRPLPQLTIRAGKLGRSRGVRYRTPPVHPALSAWIDWWLAEGFEFTHLRPPQSGDLMFPTISERRQKARKEHVSHGELYKRWQRHHLPGCGMRHRRLHDARRTLLSLVRSSAAPADVARAITHTVIADKVLDAYTTFEWKALCEAVMSVDWRLPGPPELSTKPAPVLDLLARRGGTQAR